MMPADAKAMGALCEEAAVGKDLDMAVYAAILGMSDHELITASFLPDDSDGDAAPHRHPRAPRMRTLIRAALMPAGARQDGGRTGVGEETTLVRNISERGMCLVLRGTAPHAGDIVIVRLPSHHEYRAQVRWTDGRACGVQLFEKLDVDALVVSDRRDEAPPLRTAGALRADAPMRPC